jgi:hypothetical protein
MAELNLEKLKPGAAGRIRPFLNEILEKYKQKIDSIHITGTALTEDYEDNVSDVNSIFVLKHMDLKFLELLAPLGKKYGKKKVTAPLIMTPDYIQKSLDVFPVEFLNFKLIHETVYGKDIMQKLEINRMDLRHQCERELKTKLIWLRQGYISSQGDRKILSDGLIKSIKGYIPLFRSMIVLFSKEPPIKQSDVITVLSESTGIDTSVFALLLKVKHKKSRLSIEELNTIFEAYYEVTEQLGKIVDELKE